jgi:hypothetical protein
VGVKEYPTTFSSYYSYDAPGLLVTVTRVAGASGRIAVDYTTVDGNTNQVINGDLPATVGTTNIISFFNGATVIYQTNITHDYTPVSGTLVFDDYEMSKTVLIPILDDAGQPRPNRDFNVVLSNPRLDPTETAPIPPPRLDPMFGQAECRILDCDIHPEGPPGFATIVTNPVTQLLESISIFNTLYPTNSVFNFQKKNFRVPRDVNSGFWHNTPVTIYVNRMGTNAGSETLNWRINNFFEDDTHFEDANVYFPLQAGSEYSTPPPDGEIYGPPQVDYVSTSGSESGTIAFPSGAKAFKRTIFRALTRTFRFRFIVKTARTCCIRMAWWRNVLLPFCLMT